MRQKTYELITIAHDLFDELGLRFKKVADINLDIIYNNFIYALNRSDYDFDMLSNYYYFMHNINKTLKVISKYEDYFSRLKYYKKHIIYGENIIEDIKIITDPLNNDNFYVFMPKINEKPMYLELSNKKYIININNIIYKVYLKNSFHVYLLNSENKILTKLKIKNDMIQFDEINSNFYIDYYNPEDDLDEENESYYNDDEQSCDWYYLKRAKNCKPFIRIHFEDYIDSIDKIYYYLYMQNFEKINNNELALAIAYAISILSLKNYNNKKLYSDYKKSKFRTLFTFLAIGAMHRNFNNR